MIIPVLHISRDSPGAYPGVLTDTGQELWPGSTHPSVAEVLRNFAAEIPPDLAEWVEVRYRNIAMGTFQISQMGVNSEPLAQSWVSTAAAVLQG